MKELNEYLQDYEITYITTEKQEVIEDLFSILDKILNED